MTVLNNQGVLISKKSIPDLREAVRITKQLRTQDTPMQRPVPVPWRPQYFKVKRKDTNIVTVSEIRYTNEGVAVDIADQDKTIPTAAGTYYIYFKLTIAGVASIEVSDVDTKPAPSQGQYYVREICKVVVGDDSYIKNVIPIWPGHVMHFGVMGFEKSFEVYIDVAGNLRISDGYVWVGDSTAAEVTDGGTGWDPDIDRVFYVETTTAFDTITQVTGTIQTASMDAFLDDTSTASTLITKTMICKAVDGEITVRHEGDIYFQSLYTPSYSEGYRGAAENEGNLLTTKEINGTDEDAAFTYFMRFRKSLHKFLGGELVKMTEDEEYQLGGVDEDDDFDYTDAIDTGTENQVTFGRTKMLYKLNSGLSEKFEKEAAADVILKALGKWVGIEQGGTFLHLNSPVDSTAHPDHWFTLTITSSCTLTIQQGAPQSLSSVTIYVDKKGHIWRIETDDQPPPTTNYRYIHCSDPATYSDIILAAQEANPVIDISDQCYKYAGPIQANSNSAAPTTTYADCAICEGSKTNQQWVYCSGGANAAVLSPGHTTVSVAWLCIGGVWAKCEFSHLTAAVATDPSVLKQCGVVNPTLCVQLVGWPAAEGLTGTGCDSGTYGDTNWGIRWKELYSDGNTSITGGKIRLTVDSGAPKIFGEENQAVATGDFTYIGRVDMVNFTANNAISQSGNLRLHDTAGNLVAQIYINKINADDNNKWQIEVNNPGAEIIITNWSNNFAYFRIIRTGSTIRFYYSSNGTSWTDTGKTLSSSADINPSVIGFSRWTGGNVICDWSALSYTGFANIDPTGDACV